MKYFKMIFVILLLNFAFVFILNILMTSHQKVLFRYAIFNKSLNSFEKNKLTYSFNLEKTFKKETDFFAFDNNKYKFKFASKNIIDSIITISNFRQKPEIDYLCGIYSENLFRNIEYVKEGYGCCSDYSQTLIALSIINGINTREVSNLLHTFNEIYSFEYKKWMFFDFQNKLIALNKYGVPLSSYEISQENDFQFFKIENNILKPIKLFEISPILDKYYFKNQMNTLVYTNGNNVFEVNKRNRFLFYIPRAIRQFGLILFNIQPNYLIFDPMNSLVSKLFYIKLYFIFFNLFYNKFVCCKIISF